MLFSSLLTLVAAASTTVFGKSAHGDHKSKACSRELEAIVFSPPNCAHDYLRKITQQLVIQSPLLWTERAYSVIETFENQYGVEAVFFDAFGNLWNYDNETDEPMVNAFNYNYERTVALGEAFSSYQGSNLVNYNTPFFAYSTLLWNDIGQLYTVFVMMNKTNAPLSC